MIDPVSLGLPHRPPFIFVDSIVALEPGSFAMANKRFTGTEDFFAGHFPGNAIVPGVLITEALAQTAGIAVGTPNEMYFLTGIRSMKFLDAVRPGETLQLEARSLGAMAELVQCAVTARVDSRVVAEGMIILARQRP